MADFAVRFAGKSRRRWQAATAAVLGVGIWAVHFIGVSSSASVLPAQYGVAGVVSALGLAVVGAFGALQLLCNWPRSLSASAASGFIMAATLLAVPLLGMQGPGWNASVSYHLLSLFGCAALAMAGSMAAFRLNFGISAERGPLAAVKSSGAMLLGLTVVATHYAVTNAMTFIEIDPAPSGGNAVSASLLCGLGVSSALIAVLGGASAVAVADKRALAEAPEPRLSIEKPQECLPQDQEATVHEPTDAEDSITPPEVEMPLSLAPNILSLSAAVALSAKTVLVADAGAESRASLQSLLAGWQMNPIFAPTAAEALHGILEAQRLAKPIDLVLVDSRLADGGGFALAEKLQTMQPAPPVVMLLDSADGSQQLEKRGKVRVAAHVVKPVWRADLERALVTALFRRDLDQKTAVSEPGQPPVKEGVSSRLPE
jgi:NO-binding membrane sensor protein with MHYT domain/DNA-binding NarL/FixJ family response regulator